MVDFEKLLKKRELTKSIDPLIIFEYLDKESNIESLRRSQESVLKEWHEKLRNKKDIIVKLHTGQGKTLIGLLMLQSSINEGKGPAIYICPNKYLVTQTIEQAQSFGIETVQFR
jgi:replicative superfamily II helicase